MIKIIISGTYDGFYPRYATDGVLDDSICKKLLDRRMYFSKAEDSLFKEGYSFQCVGDAGVFFHKIILLFDALGRDGFMMASLFLPDGDKLDGKDIKDALDSIIRDYKARTSNGIASIDIDWSFVKRKADELMPKVKSTGWEKHPTNSNASRTALLKGVENYIADYFNYPNPLHSGFADYGQVFLTESLLDPAMISDNGEQGYKELTTNDVDIENPEYVIVYNRDLQQGETLSSIRQTIKKKELESHDGNIYLGTLSKSGYRSAEVEIKNADKTSKNGSTITATLPTLMPKNATVELKIFDNITGEIIPAYGITIEWSNQSLNISQTIQHLGTYSFKMAQCDITWHYIVKCETYQDYPGDILVMDGIKESIEIKLVPKLLWNIYIQRPDGFLRLFYQRILDEDLNYQIKAAEGYLKQQGLDVETLSDVNTRKITVIGKKKPITNVIMSSGQATTPSGLSNTPHTGGIVNSPEIVKTIYHLNLDERSQEYSLFENYRKRVSLENKVQIVINELEQEKNNLKQLMQQGRLSKSNLEAIINQIDDLKKSLQTANDNTAEDVLKILKRSYTSLNFRSKIFNKADRAIEVIGIIKRIPDVVSEPQDIKYDSENHRLICKRTKCPSAEESIVFGKDRFKYSIPIPIWNKDDWNKNVSPVKRTLLKKYKLLYWLVGLLASIIIVTIAFLFAGNGKKLQDIKDQMSEISTTMSREYPDSYCGDSLYSKAESLNSIYMKLASKEDELQKDSIYKVFHKTFDSQSELKRKDDQVFHEALALFNVPFENFDQKKWDKLSRDFKVLTIEHQETLKSKLDNGIKQLNRIMETAAAKAEHELYGKCMGENATISLCDNFIRTYPNSFFIANVKQKKQDLLNAWELKLYNACFTADATIENCNEYLRYFKNPNNEHVKKVKEKQLQMIKAHSRVVKPETSQIRDASSLFFALKWENIYDFDDKYKVNAKGLKKRKDYVINAAKEMGESGYQEAYDKVFNKDIANSGDKLTELEKEIQKSKEEKK